MRIFTLLFSITLFPASSFAEGVDTQINKTCLRHAVSLVAKLKTDVMGDISQEKSDHALKLATESSQAYFKKEFSDTTISSNETKEESSDWLSEKLNERQVTSV